MLMLSVLGALVVFILALIMFYQLLRSNFDHLFKTQSMDRQNSYMSLSGMIDPLKESLVKIDQQVAELERARLGAYVGLKDQVEHLFKSQIELAKETKKLSRAMTAPTIRGRWGEMQLKRVLELSGLSKYCDFLEQSTIKDEFDAKRPDLIVTMPNNRHIIIDAKVPLESFITSDEDSEALNNSKELSTAIRRHLLELKKKSYSKLLPSSLEFIVMFLPTEGILAQALSADPMLIDFAAQHEIIIATPTSLIALLKAVAFSFRQDAINQNIDEVKRLAKQLIDRSGNVLEHFEKVGKNLRLATESYSQALHFLDARVFSTAKKLADLGTLEVETKSMNSMNQPTSLS